MDFKNRILNVVAGALMLAAGITIYAIFKGQEEIPFLGFIIGGLGVSQIMVGVDYSE